jgi:hypothetical protein
VIAARDVVAAADEGTAVFGIASRAELAEVAVVAAAGEEVAAVLEAGVDMPLVTLNGSTALTGDRKLVMAGRGADVPAGMMDCATPRLAALMVML